MIAILKNRKISKNPFILFLPFLFFYIILILIFASDENSGDSGRYLLYAQNLSQGFYSPPPPYIDLGNGPGYPLILMPFVAFGLPIIYLQLLNAAFYYLSIVFLFKSLLLIVSFKFSVVMCLIWAFYPTYYEVMIYTLPEAFIESLIPIFIFVLLNAYKENDKKRARKYLIISGIVLGYIALTKPIFGYVIMALIAGAFLLLLSDTKNPNLKKTFVIVIIALFTTSPYLSYTYNLTGKIFYWSSFGGNNLYWMSSPYEGEYGDWMGFPVTPDEHRISGSDSIITLRHQTDFEEIFKNKEVQEANIKDGIVEYNLLKGITQDDLFKKIAIRNIKNNPLKYLENCISNAGRMIFNYPASYVLQKPSTLRRLPINGTLLVISIFCLIPTLANWRKIIYPIRFLLFFGLIYFGGSLLGSADIRMFIIIVPILLIWIAYITSKSIKINLFWGK